jgi:hypothetical protein
MANHSQIIKKDGDLNKKDIIAVLEKMNQEEFGGNLNFEVDGKYIGINSNDDDCWEGVNMRIKKKRSVENDDGTLRTVKGKHLDIRHDNKTQFMWWLESRIMHTIANELSGEIIGEGYSGENYQETGYPIRTYKDHCSTQFKDGVKRTMQMKMMDKLRKEIIKVENKRLMKSFTPLLPYVIENDV